LKNRLPPTAIVQHNPVVAPNDLPYGLYADRPVAADTSGCGVVFGGDPADCTPVLGAISRIFSGKDTAAEADRACTDLSISAVLVKDTDPAWKNRENWIWQRRPIVGNGWMRVVECGTTDMQAQGGRATKADPVN
jgi:hypothetical protein